MGCEGSRAFAICLRACGLIRKRHRKIFGLAGPEVRVEKPNSRYNPANFAKNFLDSSGLPANRQQRSCSLVGEVSPAEPPQTKGAKIGRER